MALVFIVAAINWSMWVRINNMNAQISNIQDQIDENHTANKHVMDMLVDIQKQQTQIEELTSQDMNKIIDYWIYHMGVSSEFKDKGDAFIQAAQETGYNPIYILAHAACESAWGSSYIARTKNNYFGINAVDHDPGQSYHMGGSLEEGLSSGARWIYVNYYSNGYTSLSQMKNAGYATDPNWSYAIVGIMNKSLQAL